MFPHTLGPVVPKSESEYNLLKCSGDIITVLPGNEKDGTEDIRIRVIEVILNNSQNPV